MSGLLRPTAVLFKKRRSGTEKLAVHNLLSRYKHSGAAATPMAQLAQSRMNTVHDYMKYRNRKLNGPSDERKAFNKIYNPTGSINKEMLVDRDRTLRMQNAPIPGERGPVEVYSQPNPVDMMKYTDNVDRMQHAPPPEVYTDMMRRKVMAGQNWPAVPMGFELQTKDVPEKQHESNMSPSAQKTCLKVLYLLRKNIKACPAFIREQMNFAELMLCDVRASRRSTKVYIFWGTVTPAARYELEPILPKLNHWIKSMITYAQKEAGRGWGFPAIPDILWVYDNGTMSESLPRALKKQLNDTYTVMNTTTKDRLNYLRKMDSLSARMRGVPWFMPYLWNKDNKAMKQATYLRDAGELEKRKNSRNQAIGSPAGHVG